ncbi:methyltransferase domain-containing protein [Vagococcus xieshaowenii]|uniref:Methyltransferase domain-containing protein n=1 Tax=Vagococcus xieshaowenii TaxID=2562451 RepID=A0AAJ5JM20_9ENTE|nr:methyltransferase domain-containing protein [Vagococcus xieshaowenii]QCA28012.1 methyltransferase domain-containing protein [Vagococcus xieshaowenii]TFZ40289.1 methyltransferase domain-containing protein [Vagococcus xieshaowenii]
MLQKKIDRSASWIANNPNRLACPKCHNAFEIEGHSIRCVQGHVYNLSKKGSLYFLNKKIDSEYTKEMLSHRQQMIQTAMYAPMLEAIAKHLTNVDGLLDVGCGEGSFLQKLATQVASSINIGFDISKEGIELATSQEIEALWLVADLTNLPIQDQSMSHILNIFSPSHYHEFKRVLKPNGKLIKIIPGPYYLKELRERVLGGTSKETYSNEKVYKRFKEELTLISEEKITYEFEIPENHYVDFLYMSPLHWQASEEKREEIKKHPIKTITIDVHVLVGDFS